MTNNAEPTGESANKHATVAPVTAAPTMGDGAGAAINGATDDATNAAADDATSGATSPMTAREELPVVVRRSPRYIRLMALGAGLGAVLAFVSTFALPEAEGYTQNQVFGFLLILGLVLGGALGAIVALLLDVFVSRKSVTLVANRVEVRDGGRDSDAGYSDSHQNTDTLSGSDTSAGNSGTETPTTGGGTGS